MSRSRRSVDEKAPTEGNVEGESGDGGRKASTTKGNERKIRLEI